MAASRAHTRRRIHHMRLFFLAAMSALVMLADATLSASFQDDPPPGPMPAFNGSVAVLTYNVKGLPWPVARGRPPALERIGHELRSMHARGKAPQVVVLQEAFTREAQAIGRLGGYAYIAAGPGAGDIQPQKVSAQDQDHAAASSWWKGETQGKFVGSGLQILSDYPIVAVRRMAFGDHSCAGYDCLASKGAMLVRITIPGAPTPIDVLTTHLNSRRSSGVSDARSLSGYRRQVEELTAFVRQAHDPRFPLIAAGDYNVGSAAARRTVLLGAVQRNWVTGFEVRDAFSQFQRRGGTLAGDAAYSFKHAVDWQFFADGSQGKLDVIGIEVPFGRDKAGDMLSDHIGYVARFAISAGRSAETVAAKRLENGVQPEINRSASRAGAGFRGG